eukprot:CFRG7045T1
MVRTSPSELSLAFKKIKEDALASHPAASILILAAPDVDAVCACRLLTILLRADYIPYEILPVAGYDDIAQAKEDLVNSNDALRSVIMLNCGSNIDVMEIFDDADHINFYIIDSHRPVHLSNVFDNENVLLFLDTDAEPEFLSAPTRAEYAAANESSSDNSQPSSSDDDEEYSTDDDADSDENDSNERNVLFITSTSMIIVVVSGAYCKRLPHANEYLFTPFFELWPSRLTFHLRSTLASSNSAENANGEAESKKRKKTPKEKKDKKLKSPGRAQRRKKEKENMLAKLAHYYDSGSSYGLSTSLIAYQLASQLNRRDNEVLWCAIVGLTDQYVQESIDFPLYITEVQKLRDEVLRFNPVEDHDQTELQNNRSGRMLNLDHDVIRSADEFKLMTMRHWSLLDSLHYSNYVATTLKTWSQSGYETLLHFLAKMGISLWECREKYSEMSIKLREKFKVKLIEEGHNYGLQDLVFQSFYRRLPFRTPTSASDFVYAIAALLQRPHVQSLSSVAFAASASDPTLDEAMIEPREWLRRNFFSAFDAMSDSHLELLEMGLEFSMVQQKAVVEQVKAMSEQKAFTNTRYFRHVKTCNQYEIFASPLMLIRLALFLCEFFAVAKPDSRKPFVVSSLIASKDVYLVVGVTGVGNHGSSKKNPFGLVFRQAAEQINANFRHDSFDTNVIEVQRKSWEHFLLALDVNWVS